MGILDEDVAKVRYQSDLVAIISQYTQLKKVGRRFQGLCPFHSEKSPSFSVNAEDGLYYCFGCGAKGDAITFVREKEQLDFVGAVENLAAKSSIQLHYTSTQEGQDRKRSTKLQEFVSEAVEWFHHKLLNSPEAGPARAYLRERGFTGDIVKQFKLGWSPDGWDHLAKHLKLSNKDLTDSGLGFVNRGNRQQDFFRARIMFPIFDQQDKPVGFGGRKLSSEANGPKYKNSAESDLYSKSRILYALNWAKSEIVNNDQVVICEGYTDVIGFYQVGIKNAVATCGTALTEDHVKMLSRFTNRMVLAFDADNAGQNAALRFYEWEEKYKVDVAIADLPVGADPGDLAKNDPKLLSQAVKNSKPYLAFRLDKLLSESDLSSTEYRTRTASLALEMIKQHPNKLTRDQYVMEISSRLRISPDLLRSGLKRSSVRLSTPKRSFVKQSPQFEALKLLSDPDSGIADLLVEELFIDDEYLQAYSQVLSNDNLADAISNSPSDVADLLYKASVAESNAKAIDVASLLWANYLESLMNSSRVNFSGGDMNINTVKEHTWLRMRLEELRNMDNKSDLVAELVSWVKQGSGSFEQSIS